MKHILHGRHMLHAPLRIFLKPMKVGSPSHTNSCVCQAKNDTRQTLKPQKRIPEVSPLAVKKESIQFSIPKKLKNWSFNRIFKMNKKNFLKFFKHTKKMVKWLRQRSSDQELLGLNPDLDYSSSPPPPPPHFSLLFPFFLSFPFLFFFPYFSFILFFFPLPPFTFFLPFGSFTCGTQV